MLKIKVGNNIEYYWNKLFLFLFFNIVILIIIIIIIIIIQKNIKITNYSSFTKFVIKGVG